MGRAILIVVVLGACGEVAVQPDAAGQKDAPVDAPTFAVKGTVTGFAGRGMVLQLNGANDLPISADGAFTFTPTLADQASYTVTLKSAPICPERKCTLTGASGTIAGADATVTVTCTTPKYRLLAHNWSTELSVRLTDDLAAIANNATATPRIITGSNTTLTAGRLDSAAYDNQRDLVYAVSKTNGTVTVFNNASTATGNIAPARIISISGETQIQAVELDVQRDRLYIGTPGHLYVLTSASTQSGTLTPPVSITLASNGSATLDTINDRLFVGGDFNQALNIFDNASTLTSASTPTHTVTFTGWGGPTSVAIDSCRDRLYVGSNNPIPTTTGLFVAVFDNASALTGAIAPATASQAQLGTGQVLSLDLDSSGTLWYWPDSATLVHAIVSPQLLSGSVATVTPDKNINGVAASAYGLDVVSY